MAYFRYSLITPLVTSNGKNAALVKRGWVPADWKSDPKVRSLNTPLAEVKIEADNLKVDDAKLHQEFLMP